MLLLARSTAVQLSSETLLSELCTSPVTGGCLVPPFLMSVLASIFCCPAKLPTAQDWASSQWSFLQTPGAHFSLTWKQSLFFCNDLSLHLTFSWAWCSNSGGAATSLPFKGSVPFLVVVSVWFRSPLAFSRLPPDLKVVNSPSNLHGVAPLLRYGWAR